MSHQFLKSLRLLLAALCMASCGRTDRPSKATTQAPTESGTQPAAVVEVAVQPIPSPKEAILRAIELSKREKLFVHHSVEIAASKQPDGSVKVLFSVPTSNVMVTAGRKATEPICEVNFTRAGATVELHCKPDHHKPDPRDSESNSESLARAASTVCSGLREDDEMAFAIGVSQETDGFFVMTERIPYTPGGHTGYKVSKDFKIKDTLPGE